MLTTQALRNTLHSASETTAHRGYDSLHPGLLGSNHSAHASNHLQSIRDMQGLRREAISVGVNEMQQLKSGLKSELDTLNEKLAIRGTTGNLSKEERIAMAE